MTHLPNPGQQAHSKGSTMKASDYLSLLTSGIVCLTLAGCNSMQRDAEALVRENLKDPDSARFGTFYYNEKTKKACLTVNAKNSMGGYTGDKQVLLSRLDDRWGYVAEHEISLDDCRRAHADATD